MPPDRFTHMSSTRFNVQVQINIHIYLSLLLIYLLPSLYPWWTWACLEVTILLMASSFRTCSTLANRSDLIGTVPIWRLKPYVPPDDLKKPIRLDLSRSTPKNTILNPLLPVLFVLHSEFKVLLCLFLAFFHVLVRGRQFSKQKICID